MRARTAASRPASKSVSGAQSAATEAASAESGEVGRLPPLPLPLRCSLCCLLVLDLRNPLSEEAGVAEAAAAEAEAAETSSPSEGVAARFRGQGPTQPPEPLGASAPLLPLLRQLPLFPPPFATPESSSAKIPDCESGIDEGGPCAVFCFEERKRTRGGVSTGGKDGGSVERKCVSSGPSEERRHRFLATPCFPFF